MFQLPAQIMSATALTSHVAHTMLILVWVMTTATTSVDIMHSVAARSQVIKNFCFTML
jgi:hypothetical protein